MRVIKVNSRDKTITEIVLAKGIEAICEQLECGYFTCIDLPNGDALYIDDEGLLREEPIGAFMLQGFAQPLSGHGLIIGTDKETGESANCKSTLEFIRASVSFIQVQFLKGVPIQAGFIPLTDEELLTYWQTGKLPIGKNPQNPN